MEVPLFLPMRLDGMFHEESRVHTKKNKLRKGRTKGEETPVSVTVNLEEDRRQERQAGGLEKEGTK